MKAEIMGMVYLRQRKDARAQAVHALMLIAA